MSSIPRLSSFCLLPWIRLLASAAASSNTQSFQDLRGIFDCFAPKRLDFVKKKVHIQLSIIFRAFCDKLLCDLKRLYCIFSAVQATGRKVSLTLWQTVGVLIVL